MNVKRHSHSLKSSILMTLFLAVMPMALVLYVMNTYSVRLIQESLYESSRASLEQDMNKLDNSLQNITNWLSMQAIGNDLNSTFSSTGTDNQKNEMAKSQMVKHLAANVSALERADGLACYAPSNGNLVYVYQSGKSDYQIWSGVRELIQEQADTLLNDGKWITRQIGDTYVLLGAAYFCGVYYVSWTQYASLSEILFRSDDLLTSGHILSGEDGQILVSTIEEGDLASQEIVLPESFSGEGYYYLGKNNRYMGTRVCSQKADFNLIRIADRAEILGIFYKIPWILAAVTLLSLVIGGGVILNSLNYRVFRPIANMEKGMRKIEEGNLDTIIENYHSSTEISHLIDSFNTMTGQIKNLKIQVYEDELEHKKQEMDYLQLQLEPHFFLNALNLINMMAQVGDTELIQELTQNLSEYLRYVVSARKETVTLRQELKHVSHYLKIMEIRLGEDTFSFRCDADENLLDTPVLPLTLQTIVENSLKYAFSLDRKTSVDMTIKEKNGILRICVMDNGPGYPEEILDNFRENRAPAGKHIGLWNLKLRQEYLYKEENVFRISNRAEGGACTEIIVPAYH